MAWFRTAESAAREAVDVNLTAWLLAYQSLVSFDQERFVESHDLLCEAAVLARQGESETLRAWVDVLLARSFAVAGDERSFEAVGERATVRLDKTLDVERRHGMDFADDHLDLSYYTGSSYLALGRFGDARDAFSRALDHLPLDRRRARAMLGLSLASVASRQGQVDVAAAHVGQSLELVDGGPPGRVGRRAVEVRAGLGSAERSQSLRLLDERMAAVAGAKPTLPRGAS